MATIYGLSAKPNGMRGRVKHVYSLATKSTLGNTKRCRALRSYGRGRPDRTLHGRPAILATCCSADRGGTRHFCTNISVHGFGNRSGAVLWGGASCILGTTKSDGQALRPLP